MSSEQVKDRAKAAIVGSLVADAATQPVHWVEDPNRLNEQLRNKSEPEFSSEWLNPRYRYDNGTFSIYGEQNYVLLKHLVENKGFNLKKYMDAYYRHFGPGTNYDQPQSRDRLPKQGPWRNEHITRALNKIQSGDQRSGTDVAECDSYAMITPLVAMYAGSGQLDSYVDHVVRVTLNNDRSVRTAQFFAKLLEHYILHGRDPEGFHKVLSHFPNDQYKRDWQTAYEERSMCNVDAVRKYGYGSSLPGNFQGALNCLTRNEDYVSSVRTTMRSGGCSAARSCGVGAWVAAQYGSQCIPSNWISRTLRGREVLEYASQIIRMMKR
uniref:Crystallin J1B n=1 Tax=Tripedalia cystophora TaxID=6141 RepID=CRJ1B_TRICY|nr:RecName: Full=Crystallin J1B [Tripedalia cystophora]AAA30107.1 J1B crystallin [Tripedalia cystophora]